MDEKSISLGIDLGTTNSVAAVFHDGESKIIPNALGESITPSVIHIAGEKCIVGSVAQGRRITDPASTAALFKRRMGASERLKLGKARYSPEELSAIVLRDLRDSVVAAGYPLPSSVVISVPAYFNNPQRQATQRAGLLAGFETVELINEPTAAAIAYGLTEVDGAQFLVVDLGGGTFDVSIMEYFDGILEVHARAGDSFLGGEDFTDLLVVKYCEVHGIERTKLSPMQRQLLRTAAERAKVSIDGAGLEMQAGDWPRLKMVSHQLETLFDPLLKRMINPISRALRDAGIAPDELDDVILVGGASRLQLFRSAIAKICRRMPLAHIDPDCVVAHGAATQAALINRDAALDDVVLTDVCPHSLGVEVFNGGGRDETGNFLPIIERNFVLPASVSSEGLAPVDRKQKFVRIRVFQGEHRTVSRNVFLGEMDVAFPTFGGGDKLFDLRFSYDASGLLEVDATLHSNGKIFSMEINPGHQALTEADIDHAKRRLAKLKFHPRDDQENLRLLNLGEQIFAELTGIEREQVDLVLKRFESVLNRQDRKEIEIARKECFAALEPFLEI